MNPQPFAQYYGNDGEPLWPVALQRNNPTLGGWDQVLAALDEMAEDCLTEGDKAGCAMWTALRAFIGAQLQ